MSGAVTRVGFRISIIAFFVAFPRAKSEASWARLSIMTTRGVGFVAALSWIMVLDFPGGVHREIVVPPSPLR